MVVVCGELKRPRLALSVTGKDRASRPDRSDGRLASRALGHTAQDF